MSDTALFIAMKHGIELMGRIPDERRHAICEPHITDLHAMLITLCAGALEQVSPEAMQLACETLFALGYEAGVASTQEAPR